MKKASFIVHQNYVEDVIKRLHETGLMEFIDITKEDPEILKDVEKAPMHPDASVCTTYSLRLERIIDILKEYDAKPSGMLSMLQPDMPELKTVEEHSLEDLYSYAEGVLEDIEKNILNCEKQLKESDEEKERINSDINQLRFLEDFDLDLSDIGQSEYIVVKAGKTTDLKELEEKLKDIENPVLHSKEFVIEKNIEWTVIIAAHISQKEKLEKICRGAITEFNFESTSGLPKEVSQSLKKELKNINKNRKKIITDLKNYAKKQLPDLLALKEEVQIEQIRKEISKNFAKTNFTYLIQGWVLAKNEDTLRNVVSDITDDNLICNFESPSQNPDNPPTYLESPDWADGFKSLLEMFATPKYNEINPTVIMGIFFILFFGIMLGDAGYGIIILALSLFGYFKLGDVSQTIKSWSFMGIWMGIVTTIVGILTNSCFGNLIPLFIYGNPDAKLYVLEGTPLPLDPINDPLSILSIALIFGLIHLNIGIILGIIQKTKERKIKEMLTEKFCWIPLQIGGGLLIVNIILGWDTSQFFIIAVLMVIVGMILLFIGAGPIGFFDITGYVGDWLSYARLLALGLATAGMSLAFNVVSNLFAEQMIPAILGVILIMGIVIMTLRFLKKLSKPVLIALIAITIVFVLILIIFPNEAIGIVVADVIKIIVLIILLVMVHMVNLGLQALGAGVHSLRLQYVEFFNRFYEGGGHNFSPFKIKRTYTQIEKEKNLD